MKYQNITKKDEKICCFISKIDKDLLIKMKKNDKLNTSLTYPCEEKKSAKVAERKTVRIVVPYSALFVILKPGRG